MTDDKALTIGAQTLPTAQTIAGALKAELNERILALRSERGEVVEPADTWPMLRYLAGLGERAGEYKRAFADLEKEVRAVGEEELSEAMGEQDGVPNGGTTVPDVDGTTVRFSLDTLNSHTFDVDALFGAVAFEVLASADGAAEVLESLGLSGDLIDTEKGAALDNVLANLLTLAMSRLVELGKFEPQVTKVKTFTEQLSRTDGGVPIVSTVQSAHRQKKIYKGIKFERVYPKAK